MTRWSGGRVQVWVQVWAPACHLAISAKAVPEGNRRFRGRNQWPSFWGSSPALFVRVGQARSNTGRFRVGSSRCGQRLARLRKTCYHSCDTDSIQESTRFWCFVLVCKFRAETYHFVFREWKFRWNWREVVGNLLLTKAAPIASLNLSISHCSLSKNMI